MNTTRAERIATALRLSAALRMPAPDGAVPGSIGNCGRASTESCGMIDPQECSVHCDVPTDDPALLGLSGTLASRKQQLKLARRRALRF
jgi:hypothetical protein